VKPAGAVRDEARQRGKTEITFFPWHDTQACGVRDVIFDGLAGTAVKYPSGWRGAVG